MSAAVETRAQGLFTHPNRLALPPGAVVRAKNCVINREGVTSRRRGVNRYGDELDTEPTELFRFQGRLVVLDGDVLKYDSDEAGTWAAWPGTYSQPDSSVRMRFLESENSFLFTTDAGVYVNDALSGTPKRSGMPRGLDTQLSFTGTGGSWFLPDNQVGYRITWRRKDANGRLTQGSPSFQERLANSYTTLLAWTNSGATVTVTHTDHGFSNSDTIEIIDALDSGGSPEANIPDGQYTIANVTANTYDFTAPGTPSGGGSATLTDGKSFDVELSFTIPGDVEAGDEYEIFRTPLSAGDEAFPGDEHRLILSAEVDSSDITAGVITVTDDQPEDFFVADLYTNPSQETEDLANDRPPLARFIVEFETHVFYFRTTYPHRLTLQQLDLAALQNGDTITITDGSTTEVYTYAAAEDGPAKEFQLYTTFPTVVQNIEATTKSLQKILNRNSAAWVAHYISGFDDAPGILSIEERGIGGAAFSVTASDTDVGGSWRPELPTSGTSVQSENDERKNRYQRSKSEQPEHAPELSGGALGSGSAEILGVQKVTGAIFIYKEDGIFVISGESDNLAGDLFREDDVDPTVILSAKESLIQLNNAVVGYANQGAFVQAGGSPLIIDRPQVQDDLRRIAALAAFAKAFAVGYETENSFIFFTPENSADSEAEIAHVWNYSTNTWATWEKPCQSAIILGDRLYLGHNSDKYVLKERKSLNRGTREDYSDEDIPITIDAAGTTVVDDEDSPEDGETVTTLDVTYTYLGKALAAGFIVQQGASRTYVEQVTHNGGTSYTLRLRRLVTGFTTGAAQVQLPIDMEVEWVVSGKNPTEQAQFAECNIYPQDAGGTHQLAFHSDQQEKFEYVRPIRVARTKGWGSLPWGSFPWGNSNPGRAETVSTPLPVNHQHGRVLRVLYENHYARESVDILAMTILRDPYAEKSQREPR